VLEQAAVPFGDPARPVLRVHQEQPARSDDHVVEVGSGLARTQQPVVQNGPRPRELCQRDRNPPLPCCPRRLRTCRGVSLPGELLGPALGASALQPHDEPTLPDGEIEVSLGGEPCVRRPNGETDVALNQGPWAGQQPETALPAGGTTADRSQ
jgi:hypothetical protein